jgi:hypothetical protein
VRGAKLTQSCYGAWSERRVGENLQITQSTQKRGRGAFVLGVALPQHWTSWRSQPATHFPSQAHLAERREYTRTHVSKNDSTTGLTLYNSAFILKKGIICKFWYLNYFIYNVRVTENCLSLSSWNKILRKTRVES